MRVIVFGTGVRYEKKKERLKYFDIIAIVDNNQSKQDKWIDGYIIESPDRIIEYSYDGIIVTAKAIEEIKCQLHDMGVSDDVIYDINKADFPFSESGYRRVINYVPKCSRKEIAPSIDRNRILMVSHDLSRTGAPMALLNMAIVLSNWGYIVKVISIGGDALVTDFLANDIPCSIYEDFDFCDTEISEFVSDYDLMICNTTVLQSVIKMFDGRIHILWWIHEMEEGYPFIPEGFIVGDTVSIIAGGQRAKKCVEKSTNKTCDVLLYTIPEVKTKGGSRRAYRDKTVFAMVGLDERKNPSLLIDAIKRNYEEWKDKAIFLMIGYYPNNKENELDCIRFLGEVSNQYLIDLYKDIDVIVCPSKSDTLPVVVTMGWMMKKCCIVSDKVGSSDFIEHKENGMVFKSGDVDELSNCIRWAMDRGEELQPLGDNAYRIYQDFFSRKEFEHNLERIINSIRSR